MDRTLEMLLQQKLTFLNTMANIGMTWWVSAIVFCSSIMAATWLKRSEIVKLPVLHLFCVTVSVFLTSVVGFGFWMSYMTTCLESDVRAILATAPTTSQTAMTDFRIVQIGYLIGTSSFTLVTFCWVGLWRYLSTHRVRGSSEKLSELKKKENKVEETK